MKTNYTKEDLMNPKHVVFCATREEWDLMNSIVGFQVTSKYHGPYCYSPFGKSYSSCSSRTYTGDYGEVKILHLSEEKMVRTISAADAMRIIDIACTAWKDRLAEMWGKNITLGYKVEIEEDFYKQMRGACTSAQNLLFDEIFKDDIKPGDWVITTKEQSGAYKPEAGEVFQIDSVNPTHVRFDGHKFVNKSRIRKATEEEIRIAQMPKDGEPCWVRDFLEESWSFRYANGKGQFYENQKKSGFTTKWNHWMTFDPNNLPVRKEE